MSGAKRLFDSEIWIGHSKCKIVLRALQRDGIGQLRICQTLTERCEIIGVASVVRIGNRLYLPQQEKLILIRLNEFLGQVNNLDSYRRTQAISDIAYGNVLPAAKYRAYHSWRVISTVDA
jgi:hypothetical protein